MLLTAWQIADADKMARECRVREFKDCD